MVQLADLVKISDRVASTARKKEKIAILADFLKQAQGKEIALAAAYLSGQIPQGRLGIGWATVQEALKGPTGNSKPVTLNEMDEILQGISQEQGAGSGQRKITRLKELLSRAGKEGRDFLIRLIMGEIRQGALEGLLLEGVAEASSIPAERLRQALMFSADLGEVARAALEERTVSRFQPRLFRPISPMLANPAEGEEEALDRLGEAGWEYKVDGARIQVHKEGEEVRIFTRSLKDITESVPELVTMARGFPLEKGVLEGEAIALREDGRPLPFQVTMRRFGRIQTERLLQLKVNENEWTVYVKPELVVEVAFSDLQESPRYSGGLALRFARVKRYREDKSPQETDTLQKVWAIFESQRR